jgi:hypothetical protein
MKVLVSAAVTVIFVTSYAFAQGPAATQPGLATQPERAPAARNPSAGGPGTRSQPTAIKAGDCLYEGKEYSIGAVLCISGQLSILCAPPDDNHPSSRWNPGQQPLCTPPVSATTNSSGDASISVAPTKR